MNNFIKGVKCGKCNREANFDPKVLLCPNCGWEIEGGLYKFPGLLEIKYKLKEISRKLSPQVLSNRTGKGIWKYKEFLPVSEEINRISMGEGSTPLIKAERLGKEFGLKNLYLKNEMVNPSGCFKDRETAILINLALAGGFSTVSCASTGSSAASLAAYGAKNGIRTTLFIPRKAVKGKINQMLVFGAEVFSVLGIYEQALGIQIEASKKHRWYNGSAGINSFRIEGNKTIAFEICEQLGWEAPGKVIVPTGGGGNLAGEWKGFKEFKESGFINFLPQMVAVQSEKGYSLVKSFLNGFDEPTIMKTGKTIAGSILSAYADYGMLALKALRESKGETEVVSDQEIIIAQELLARLEGIFAEPSSAAGIAGLTKMIKKSLIDPEETIVCVITGTGLREDGDLPQKIKNKAVFLDPKEGF